MVPAATGRPEPLDPARPPRDGAGTRARSLKQSATPPSTHARHDQHRAEAEGIPPTGCSAAPRAGSRRSCRPATAGSAASARPPPRSGARPSSSRASAGQHQDAEPGARRHPEHPGAQQLAALHRADLDASRPVLNHGTSVATTHAAAASAHRPTATSSRTRRSRTRVRRSRRCATRRRAHRSAASTRSSAVAREADVPAAVALDRHQVGVERQPSCRQPCGQLHRVARAARPGTSSCTLAGSRSGVDADVELAVDAGRPGRGRRRAPSALAGRGRSSSSSTAAMVASASRSRSPPSCRWPRRARRSRPGAARRRPGVMPLGELVVGVLRHGRGRRSRRGRPLARSRPASRSARPCSRSRHRPAPA